jgi:hypothetical protein
MEFMRLSAGGASTMRIRSPASHKDDPKISRMAVAVLEMLFMVHLAPPT